MSRHIVIFTFLFLLLSAVCVPSASAQEILTPDTYFAKLSDTYRDLQDYTARISIKVDKEEMRGELYYRKPNLLRINFTEPNEQVITVDGEVLTVYIPEYRVALTQTLRKETQAGRFALATREGLALMRRNYHISFLKDPEPAPLDPESQEMVVNLKLIWKSTEEGFRQIDLAVGSSGMIRRIVGITAGYKTVQMDFTEIRKNQNIPEGRFRYDAPPSANMITDFLGFSAEN